LRLGDTLGDTGDQQEDQHGQERREEGGDGVLRQTVLATRDDTGDDESREVSPRDRSGEGEAADERVQGLRFNFLGNEDDLLLSRHGFSIYNTKEKK